MEIKARNANELFSEMFWKLKTCGVKAESRNGAVIRFPEPVLTHVMKPMERVLFHDARDANPIFHLIEPLWMLAGRRDVAFLQQFNSKIGRYSDNGYNFNAAYGYRMRAHFGMDQLVRVISELSSNPESRQAVVQLWCPEDLGKKTLDKACNMQLVFEIQDGKLNMLTINRSNDMWYGYAGANIVHFTVIQEFVARAIGVEIGVYRTVSNNLHLYTEMYPAGKYLVSPPYSDMYDLYTAYQAETYPIMKDDNWEEFLRDCEHFCNDPFEYREFYHPFFNDVAVPMAQVSKVRKEKTGTGFAQSDKIRAEDWRIATQQWIGRREEAKERK